MVVDKAQEHRDLAASWTVDACLAACENRLDYLPTFFFNIYQSETTGEQLCTCCPLVLSTRIVPG